MNRTEELSAMNDALNVFANRWNMDGDYLRCVKCKRPMLASRIELDFIHETGCKNASTSEPRPWLALLDILRPIDGKTIYESLFKAAMKTAEEAMEYVQTHSVEFDLHIGDDKLGVVCSEFLKSRKVAAHVKSTTGEAAVDQDYEFMKMTGAVPCPVNVKVQLLGPDNVAVYGTWNGRDTWPKGWAPLPKIPKSMR